MTFTLYTQNVFEIVVAWVFKYTSSFTLVSKSSDAQLYCCPIMFYQVVVVLRDCCLCLISYIKLIGSRAVTLFSNLYKHSVRAQVQGGTNSGARKWFTPYKVLFGFKSFSFLETFKLHTFT